MFSIEIGPRHIGAAAEIECLISEALCAERGHGKRKGGCWIPFLVRGGLIARDKACLSIASSIVHLIIHITSSTLRPRSSSFRIRWWNQQSVTSLAIPPTEGRRHAAQDTSSLGSLHEVFIGATTIYDHHFISSQFPGTALSTLPLLAEYTQDAARDDEWPAAVQHHFDSTSRGRCPGLVDLMVLQ
jgi:hypothetical protein